MNRHRVHLLTQVLLGVSVQTRLLSAAWGYEAIEVKDGGTISGEVTFAGNPPPPEKIATTKDQDVCGKTEKVNESLLVGPNKGIQNVVVSLTNIQKGKKMPDTGATLDQKDCRYAPHVVLTPVGTEMAILNSDGILHNIHTYSTKNPPFNKAQPKFKPKMTTDAFTQPEVVKLTCDAHGWMSGWLVVEDNPYYAVTDATGAFKIIDIPPADYEVNYATSNHRTRSNFLARHILVKEHYLSQAQNFPDASWPTLGGNLNRVAVNLTNPCVDSPYMLSARLLPFSEAEKGLFLPDFLLRIISFLQLHHLALSVSKGQKSSSVHRHRAPA